MDLNDKKLIVQNYQNKIDSYVEILEGPRKGSIAKVALITGAASRGEFSVKRSLQTGNLGGYELVFDNQKPRKKIQGTNYSWWNSNRYSDKYKLRFLKDHNGPTVYVNPKIPKEIEPVSDVHGQEVKLHDYVVFMGSRKTSQYSSPTRKFTTGRVAEIKPNKKIVVKSCNFDSKTKTDKLFQVKDGNFVIVNESTLDFLTLKKLSS